MKSSDRWNTHICIQWNLPLQTPLKSGHTRYSGHFCWSRMLYCWQPCKMNLWNTDPLYSVMWTRNCGPNRIITCKVFHDIMNSGHSHSCIIVDGSMHWIALSNTNENNKSIIIIKESWPMQIQLSWHTLRCVDWCCQLHARRYFTWER